MYAGQFLTTKMESIVTVIIFLAALGRVEGEFVLFHHYQIYDSAYMTCHSLNMRLVRVDSEAKYTRLLAYTQGMKNFTVISTLFQMGLMYNINSSTYQWADGTMNTLTDKWMSGEPDSPDTKRCVVQYGGQSNNIGKWRTHDCNEMEPFVCEIGYPPDPAIPLVSPIYTSYKMFRKVEASGANIYPQDHATDTTLYARGVSDDVIYSGHIEDDLSICTVRCTQEVVCTAITYTTRTSPRSRKDVCIILRRQ